MDVIGNVKHQTIKPPEEEDLPTSPGHLIFDADFESGNLGKVEYCGNNEYDLYIRVDTCNQKYRLWFHYSVTNAKVGQTCIFHIVNFSKVNFQNDLSILIYELGKIALSRRNGPSSALNFESQLDSPLSISVLLLEGRKRRLHSFLHLQIRRR